MWDVLRLVYRGLSFLRRRVITRSGSAEVGSKPQLPTRLLRLPTNRCSLRFANGRQNETHLKRTFVKPAFRYGEEMRLEVPGFRASALLLGFGALFTLQACFHRGTTVESFPPARTPKGVTG